MLISKSYKKGVVTSTALNAVVKAINFFNIIIIARLYGTSIDTDIYFYLFSFVNLIATFVNGMDLSVIIPEGMHLQESKGPVEAMRFYNFFAYAYALLGVLLFCVLFFFSVPVFNAISSFHKPDLNAHRSLLLLGSLLPGFIIVSAYLGTVLTTLKFFIAPLLVSFTVQSITLFTLLVLYKTLGINAAMLGLVVGYGLNIVLLLLIMRFKLHWHFGFSREDVTRRIGKNLFSVELGNLASTAYSYGIIFILSGMAAGIYSAYNYSMQIVNIPVTFIVAQAAAVVGIKFNELSARQEHGQLNKIFQDSTSILLFLLIPVCFLTTLYAEEAVRFLFFRKGFSEESVKLVTQFLKCLIFLIPCLLLNTFISRLMTANRKVSQVFYFQVGFNVLSLVILFVCTRLWGIQGFIWATLVSYYLYIIVACPFLFKRVLDYIDYKKILRNLLTLMVINIPLFYLFREGFKVNQPIIFIFLLGGAYYSILVVTNYFFKINASSYTYLHGAVKMFLVKLKR